MKLEMIVNGESVDFLQKSDFDIQFWRKSINYLNVAEKNGAFTRQIKLPLTPKNNRIFEFAQLLSINKPLQTNLNCQMFANGVLLISGKMNILEVNNIDKTLTAFVTSDSVSFKEAIGDKLLHELNFEPIDFDGGLTIKRINNELDLDAPAFDHNQKNDIVFPLISYGNFFIPNNWTPQNWISSDYFYADVFGNNPAQLPAGFEIGGSDRYFLDRWANAHFKFTDFPPSIYLLNIIRQIFKDAGYSVFGKIFSDNEANKLIVPFTGNSDGWNWAFMAKASIKPVNLQIAKAVNFAGSFGVNVVVINPNELKFSDLDIDANHSEKLEFIGLEGGTGIDLYGGVYYNNYDLGGAGVLLPALYANGSGQFQDSRILENRAFALYKKEREPNWILPGHDSRFSYIAPVSGKYRLTIQHRFISGNTVNDAPAFGLNLTADQLAFSRAIALISRKVRNDKPLTDFGILRQNFANSFPSPPLKPDDSEYFGHFISMAANPAGFGAITTIMENDLQAGEELQTYLAAAFIFEGFRPAGISSTDGAIRTSWENIDHEIIDFIVEYVSPSLEAGKQLSESEQIVFDKKSDVKLHPELFLQPVKQIDLVREFVKMFNLYLNVDPISKTVHFENFQDHFLPSQTAIDLTAKTRKGVKKQIDFFQRFSFKYATDSEYWFNSLNENWSLLIDNPNLPGGKKENEIALELFSPTRFRSYQIVFDGKDVNNFVFPHWENPLAGVSLNLPTYADKANINAPNNSFDPQNKEFGMKIIKLKRKVRLSGLPPYDPNFNDAYSPPDFAYKPFGGLPVRVWDAANVFFGNKGEVRHFSKFQNPNSGEYDLWQYYIECVFEDSIFSLRWGGDSGLYVNFWKDFSQFLFSTYEYEISAQITEFEYNAIENNRTPIRILGDVFYLNEIRGFSALKRQNTTLVLLKKF